MTKFLVLIGLIFSLQSNIYAQLDSASTNSDGLSITCNPFNPEDSLGIVIWDLFNDYEKYGHLGNADIGSIRKDYVTKLGNLFAPNAMLPNDLEGYEQLVQKLSIEEYETKAAEQGYQPYSLVSEKGDFTATRADSNSPYIGYARIFKIFSDTARLGKQYERGVMYEFEVQINADSSTALISNITLIDNKVYSKFMLTGFGYLGSSKLLLSNNLDKLITYKEPPKPKVPKWTKSGFFLHGGYLFTSYLNPEAFSNNLGTNNFSGSEYGYVGGVQFQKVYGESGIFGILFGLEYELNYYDFNHSALRFEYFTDCDGNPLVDLENQPYDKKTANVSSYEESGEMSFIRPEIGLFVNLGLGKSANLQLFGTVGNAFVFSSNYNAKATVSYTGEKDGNQISGVPELGFYRDLEVDFTGELQNLQNFMFYRAGATLDLKMSSWLAFSILAEYRGSLTYAMRFREFNCTFLDPADERTFVSQFDQLSASRYYDAIGIQAGFKIFIKEKKRQD